MSFRRAQLIPALDSTLMANTDSALTPEEISELKNKIEPKIATLSLNYLNQRSKEVQAQISSLKNIPAYINKSPIGQYNKISKSIAKLQIFIDEIAIEPNRRKTYNNPTSTDPLIQNSINIFGDNVSPDFNNKDLNYPESDLSQTTKNSILQLVDNKLTLFKDHVFIKKNLNYLWKLVQYIQKSSGYNDPNNSLYKKYRYAVKWYKYFIFCVGRRSDQTTHNKIQGNYYSPTSHSPKDDKGLNLTDLGTCDTNIFAGVLCELAQGGVKQGLMILINGGINLGLSIKAINYLKQFLKIYNKTTDFSKTVEVFNRINSHQNFIKETSEIRTAILSFKKNAADASKALDIILNACESGKIEDVEKIAKNPLLKVAFEKFLSALGMFAAGKEIFATFDLISQKYHNPSSNVNWMTILDHFTDALIDLQFTPFVQELESMTPLGPILPAALDGIAAIKPLYKLVTEGGLINKFAWIGVGDQEQVNDYEKKINSYYEKNLSSTQTNLSPDVQKFINDIEGYYLLDPYIKSNNWKWIFSFLRNPNKLNLNQDFIELRDKIIKDYPWILNGSSDPNIINLLQLVQIQSNPKYNDVLNIFLNNPHLFDIYNGKTLFYNYYNNLNQAPKSVKDSLTSLHSQNNNYVMAIYNTLLYKDSAHKKDIYQKIMNKYFNNNVSEFNKFIQFMNRNVANNRIVGQSF